MFDERYVNRPTFVILQTKGMRDVISRYPNGFKIMLTPILRCLIQGIVDENEIKDFLYEDTCEGLLIDYCHCGGLHNGCRDCEDSIAVDALACGFIEAILNVFQLNEELRNTLLANTETCDFYDFEVIVIDPDSIMVTPHR